MILSILLPPSVNTISAEGTSWCVVSPMQGSIVKMGPGGGGGGDAWKMDMRGINRIVKVVVCHNGAVDAMSVLYERDGQEEETKLWG